MPSTWGSLYFTEISASASVDSHLLVAFHTYGCGDGAEDDASTAALLGLDRKKKAAIGS